MRAALLLVLASLSYSACQEEDVESSVDFSAGFASKMDLDNEYQGFLAPIGNSSTGKEQIEVSAPAGALVRRDCAAGQKACSSNSCAPADATCCSNNKYCPNGGKCCLNSCAVQGGTCCAAGHSCDVGEECCESKCIPAGTNCCRSNGGSYCIQGNQCVIYDGRGVCCTDLSCTAYVGDNGVTTSRFQTYTYTYTFYWYSYYYTIIDLTSTRRTTRTTWYVSATDRTAANSVVATSTSSFKKSLSAAANTTPSTTPTARATAATRTARSTAAPEPTDVDLDVDDTDSGDNVALGTSSTRSTTAAGPTPTLLSGGPDVPPRLPGAAAYPKELNMLCFVSGLIISVVLMKL